MTTFSDVFKPYTRSSSYGVDVSLGYLADHISHYIIDYELDMSPDFQRNYVWRQEQKERYMEYFLRGGRSGRELFFNCSNWGSCVKGPGDPSWHFVLVDGKQRLDAAIGFINNEYKVCGYYYKELEGYSRQSSFRVNINDLATYQEVLQWYLDLNTGGTVHTNDELEKVEALIKIGQEYVKPPTEERLLDAKIDRQAYVDVRIKKAAREAELNAAAEVRRLEEAARPKRKVRKSRLVQEGDLAVQARGRGSLKVEDTLPCRFDTPVEGDQHATDSQIDHHTLTSLS